MSQQDINKIIERVKKLHAKAESAKAIGSVEEAEAFAIGVQKMLLEYKLEMSILEQRELTPTPIEVDEDLIDWRTVKEVGYKRRRVGWLEQLAWHVTQAYGCTYAIIPGTNAIIIVGEQADRKVAEFVLTTLARSAVELAAHATRKERYRMWKAGTVRQARGFTSSWLLGFAAGVGVQLRERLDALRRDTPGLAIVLQRSTEAVDEYCKTRFKRSVKEAAKQSNNNLTGFLRGKEAGKQAKIDTGAVGATRDATKASLNPGQKALPSGEK